MKEFNKNQIGTEKARAEHQYGRDERAKDEEKVFGAKAADLKRLADGGINFALYNFTMSTTSFQNCKPGTLEPLHLLYKMIMVHLNRVSKEAAEMAKELNIDFTHPTDMATESLKEIQRLAKQRAKLNEYARKAKNIKTFS